MRLVVIFLFLLLISLPVYSESFLIRGEESGRWDMKEQTFVLQGGVEVVSRDRDIRVLGDRLIWDVNRQKIYVEGNVQYFSDDQKLTGSALTFDLEKSEGRFLEAGGRIPLEDGEAVYYQGETIDFAEGYLHIFQGKITTCDDFDAHYHIRAREIEVYPGHRLIVRGVTYYEGRIPLFYWPYLVVPLDLLERDILSNLPQIGRSELEGWYIKTNFDYLLNPDSYGTMHLDYLSLLGLGLGLTHNYILPWGGSGRVMFYTIATEDSPIVRGMWEHKLDESGVRFDTQNSYDRTVTTIRRSEILDSRTTLAYKTPGGIDLSIRNTARSVVQGSDERFDLNAIVNATYSAESGLRLDLRNSFEQEQRNDQTNSKLSSTANFNHRTSGGVSLSSRNTLQRELRQDIITLSATSSSNIRYSQPGQSSSGTIYYRRIVNESQDRDQEDWRLSANFSQDLSDRLRLIGSGTYTYRDTETTMLRMVDYSGKLQYHLTDHTVTLTVQERYNPELLEDDRQADWSSVNRRPELVWQWRNPTLASLRLPGTLEVGAGVYQEFPAGTEGIRYRTTFDLASQTWQPVSAVRINYLAELHQDFYSTGDSQSGLFGRVNVNYNITDNLSGTLSQQYRQVWDESPFFFDRLQPISKLTGTINYGDGITTVRISSGYDFLQQQYDDLRASLRLNNRELGVRFDANATYRIDTSVRGSVSYSSANSSLRLNGGYNFLTERYDNLSGDIRVANPERDWQFELSGAYDINNQSPVRAVTSFAYNPSSEADIKVGGRYSFSRNQWDRIDGRLTLRLTDTWNVSYEGIYSPISDRFERGQLTFALDLHCRSLHFSYDQVRQEYWIGYSLKAFPDAPLRVGRVSDKVMFDFGGVQEAIGL